MKRIFSISIWLDGKSSKGIMCNFILRVPPLCKSRSGMCCSETGSVLYYNFWSSSAEEADIFSQMSLQWIPFLSVTVSLTEVFSTQLTYVVCPLVLRLSLETYETQQCNRF